MTRANAKPRGGYTRPQGPFILDATLPMPGALALPDALDRVVADWRAQASAGTVAASTVNVDISIARGLVAFATAQGAAWVADVDSEMVWAWMGSLSLRDRTAPTHAQQVTRRAIARNVFRTLYRLGVTDANPAAQLTIGARPVRVVNALTDREVQALKDAADYDALAGRNPDQHRAGASKTAPAVALALLGAQGGEVGAVRCRDLDLLNAAVWVHGGGERYTDRWLPIDDPWCFDILAARVAFLAEAHPHGWHDVPVAYEATSRGTVVQGVMERRRSAVATTLTKAMDRAGIRRPGRNRVASITDHVAARVFAASGRVEDVAIRLGITSLDTAAHIVDHPWRTSRAFIPGTGQ